MDAVFGPSLRPMASGASRFKVLVLQALYNLSDAQAEFQILDRRSFGRFLGIDDGDRVPDETTIWCFREALVQANAIERLFARFDAYLRAAGCLAMSGQIVDASIVAAPRQRMSEEERAIVKGGGTPEGWKEKPAKLAQKGEPMSAPRVRAPWANDARWTLKRGRHKRRPDGSVMAEIATPVFGYSERENAMVRVNPRTHINVDRRFVLIRKWSVTDAFGAVLEPVAADPSPHDGRELGRLLDRENIALGVWADTAYRSQKNEKRINAAGLRSMIHFRKPPGKGLTSGWTRSISRCARAGGSSLWPP
ncbi:transposase [Meinhardsimonia xiamenensis]|jgi:hypothetical protein|uniref:transposase n=1 Tax=Meinhardsimonia xiamenensis TaxID=990712 RepID=UPI000D04C233|nr:transposase-like protein DUF772 [Meinhardsimonia xiamenensis]